MRTSYKINSKSVEYLPVQIIVTKGGSPFDPTVDDGYLAVPVETIEPTTWFSATWETIGSNYYLRILVGTGADVALEPGTYDVYSKISDDPETPVTFAGKLFIT